MRYTLFPASTTEFFPRNAEARLTFILSREGTVEGFIWQQNGHDLPAQRAD